MSDAENVGTEELELERLYSMTPEAAERSTEEKAFKANAPIEVAVVDAVFSRSGSVAGVKYGCPEGFKPRYYMLVLSVRALMRPGDAESAAGRTIKVFQCLPTEPAHWEDELDEQALAMLRNNLDIFQRQVHSLMHAFAPDEVADYPRWDKQAGGFLFDGEIVDRDEARAIKTRLNAKADEIIGEAARNGQAPLVGRTAFCRVTYDTSGEFADSPRLEGWNSEPLFYQNKRMVSVEALYGDDAYETRGTAPSGEKPAGEKPKASKKKAKKGGK